MGGQHATGPRRARGTAAAAAGCAAALALAAPSSLGAQARPGAGGVPPLPAPPPDAVAYAIEARLDPERREIDGRLTLDWRNDTSATVERFPFHLYWNAFRDGRSSFALESGIGDPGPGRRGSLEIEELRLTEPWAEDLLPGLRFVQPDDGNRDDRTLAEVRPRRGIAPGERARFEIAWRGRLPHGGLDRAGWTGDEVVVAQWYPKLAGRRGGDWSAHQHHAWSEFFGSFGSFDVTLTLPGNDVVGASGRLVEERRLDEGSRRLHFVAESVHDFAWAASPRFAVYERRLEQPGADPVQVRLLLQPENRHHAERYLRALQAGLERLAVWAAPYPRGELTAVDPAWRSRAGGMEYPGLITLGAPNRSPPALREVEEVAIHELAHQLWPGLVATDEPEQAWLDEGLASWAAARVIEAEWGERGVGRRLFGLGGGPAAGWPVVAPWVVRNRGSNPRTALRNHGLEDPVARRSFEYRTRESWGTHTYDAPELALQTLAGLVGPAAMDRIVATWTRRHAFSHPDARDFVAVVEEVTGESWSWFFDQVWYSSELCDYDVLVEADPGGGSAVTVRRRGGIRMPVELLVELEDGRMLRESWDGRERWRRYRYADRVILAVVDPDARLPLDVDPSNNAWTADTGLAPRAASKWSLRFLVWLQALFELHALVP
jgi:hypothetical protein